MKSVFGNVINPNDNYEIHYRDTIRNEHLIHGRINRTTEKFIYVDDKKNEESYIIPIESITFMQPSGVTIAHMKQVKRVIDMMDNGTIGSV